MNAMRSEEKKRSFEDMVKSSLEREQEEAARARVSKPIEATNKGNKMLQAMGWSQGQGLGRDAKGITAPISSAGKQTTAGLGAGEQ